MLCSFVAVELMRSGVEPTAAAAAAVRRISHVYPSISAGVVALNMTGDYGKPALQFHHSLTGCNTITYTLSAGIVSRSPGRLVFSFL